MIRTGKRRGTSAPARILAILLSAFVLSPVFACTIVVLTDKDNTLFVNNEDSGMPATRVWFIPGGEDFYGAVYFGYDNGWGQGGMNTRGLAYDWVSGYDEESWNSPSDKMLYDNPAERMLEVSTTVDEAIEFFRQYPEPSFSYARMMVADRDGNSAIIGARDGELHIERSTVNHGFGHCGTKLTNILSTEPEVSVESGFDMLFRCAQNSETSQTQYSNIFNLKTLDIYLRGPLLPEVDVELNLLSELEKGGHYYDIPAINSQLHAELKPLENNMKRPYVLTLESIPDGNPDLTARLTAMIEDIKTTGVLDQDHFAPTFWEELSQYSPEEIRTDFPSTGSLLGISLVENVASEEYSFLYHADFENTAVFLGIEVDDHYKLSAIHWVQGLNKVKGMAWTSQSANQRSF